jgi:hypothetical protein
VVDLIVKRKHEELRPDFEKWAGDHGYDLARAIDGYTDIRTTCLWRGWFWGVQYALTGKETQ